MWQDLFVPGVPVLEKVIRTLLVYVFLVLALRLAGKRELAQLNTLDLVVLLLLSNTVQNAIIGNDNSLLGGLLGAVVMLATNMVLNRLLYRYPQFDRLIEGNPTVLIEHGVVNKANCDRELVTHAELSTALHKQGFDSFEQIERAVLMPDGTFMFTGKQPSQDDQRYQEILARLDALHAEVSALRANTAR